MGLSLRLYIFDSSGGIKRLPLTRYNKLKDGELNLPRYASSSVRLAEVVLKVVDRLPQKIIHLTGSVLHFDSNGSYQDSYEEHMQLTRMSIGYHLGIVMKTDTHEPDKTLIQAEDRFNDKTLNDKYTWELTSGDINRLIDIIWSPKPANRKNRHGLKLVKNNPAP